MKKKKENNVVKFLIIFTTICIIVFCIVFMIKLYESQMDDVTKEVTYTNHEITTEAKAYILLDETVVDYDETLSFVPLATSNERVLKGSILGIYKNDTYDENLIKLNELDSEINEKLATLTSVYSSDVSIIENKINDLVKSSDELESIIDISNYKLQLDKLLYEKALTISSLTPSGDEITELIDERNTFYDAMNNTSDNVKSPLSGIVVYENDGLENEYTIDNIKSVEKIEEMITEYDSLESNNFGVKIVDNYSSYIVIKDDKENDKYALVGYYYDIELIDLAVTLRAELVDKISTTTENYYIFNPTNNIESFIDKRVMNVKVIFETLEAFEVENTSIYSKNGINYVKIYSLNEYIEIPVNTLLRLNEVSYVENYTTDELTELGITSSRNLIVYDRVMIEP